MIFSFLKKKKDISNNIPEGTIKEFEDIEKEIERRCLESDGKYSPYKVLYKYARKKGFRKDEGVGKIKPVSKSEISTAGISEEHGRQQFIQGRDVNKDRKVSEKHGEPKLKHFSNVGKFLSRIRRKR